MKFGKQFAKQMVHEWQQAYMDYNYLKTVLKDILNFRRRKAEVAPPPVAMTPNGSLKRRVSLYRAFSGLTGRLNSLKASPRNNEEEAILVGSVQEESSSSDGYYQTMFLMSSEEGGEYELVFFRRLDDEFNKVLKFYKEKVEEVVKEAEELNKQMDALIALRIKVDNPAPAAVVSGSSEQTTPSPNAETTSSISTSLNRRNSGTRVHMDVIQEVEMSSSSSEAKGDGEEKAGNERGRNSKNLKGNNGVKPDYTAFKPAPIEVLKHVKINVEPQTPVSTLRSVLLSCKTNLLFSKEELLKVEEQLRMAFVQFYQKLRLLQSYCFLNLLGFSKILKKYDKITLRSASRAYLNTVDKSYLGSSNEVSRLLERVESTFVRHFCSGNRSKGMKILRPQPKRERHRVTFLLGFFSGCSLALAVAVAVVINARDLLNSEGRDQYMENIFPLYSLFGFLVLHMLLLSGNIYFWRRFRINYPFIFGLNHGEGLGYKEVLLLSAGLSLLTTAGVLSNLNMDMDPRTRTFRPITELVPLGLVLFVLAVLFCPLNVVYRSSRFFLIQCAVHCICAPLYKVTMADMFLADQLTSQVQVFRSLEFYICYYGGGNFRNRSNNCQGSDVYRVFYIIVAVIPYWTRFIQCLRRYFEEKDRIHGLNGLKYFSTIVAVVMRAGHDLRWGNTWRIMGGASSAVATVVSTYWDIVIDWGLLTRNSTNPWLRDNLLVPNKVVYFIAMIMNVILRMAWMQSVLELYEAPSLHRRALSAIVACLEVVRRGVWNFFRLENEHLNNVGKYRAFKSVPLPFNYNDEHKHVL